MRPWSNVKFGRGFGPDSRDLASDITVSNAGVDEEGGQRVLEGDGVTESKIERMVECMVRRVVAMRCFSVSFLSLSVRKAVNFVFHVSS